MIKGKTLLMRFKDGCVFLISFDDKISRRLSSNTLLPKLLKISSVLVVLIITVFQHNTVGSPFIFNREFPGMLLTESDSTPLQTDSVSNIKSKTDTTIDSE